MDGLSSINIDPKELVDARWFEKEDVYLAARNTDMMGAVWIDKLLLRGSRQMETGQEACWSPQKVSWHAR